MKKITLLLLLLMFLSETFAQNLKKLDEKNGFRNYIFGTNISQYPDLKEIADEEGYYTSLIDTLKIGDYDLKRIAYSFYKDKLTEIVIETEGYLNSRGFLSILQKAYGSGYKPNRYMEKYAWLGKKVKMMYQENSITNDATVLIFSVELSKLKDQEEENSVEKATKDL